MDELNLTLILTEKVHKNMGNFEPHHNILTLSGPNDFSNNLKFPKTVVSNINTWFVG